MKIIEYQIQRFDLLLADYQYKERQGELQLKYLLDHFFM